MPAKNQFRQFSDEDIKQFVIDSPEKAYSLGFIWGDGHLKSNYKSNIYYPNVEIIKDDLDKIIHIFNSWGKWNVYYRHRKNRRPQGAITCCNSYFGWFLYQNDYLIKSHTEPTKILSITPERLKQYWWRGFSDADGCFFKGKTTARQFCFVGTHNQTWEETIKLFNQLDIDPYNVSNRTHKNSKGSYSASSMIRISSKSNVIKFGDYIYKDNLAIGLDRKFQKFLSIKNSPALIKVYTIEFAQELAQLKNGKCLSTEYKNMSSNLEWECAEQHQWGATLASIKIRGSWCQKCSAKNRKKRKL